MVQLFLFMVQLSLAIGISNHYDKCNKLILPSIEVYIFSIILSMSTTQTLTEQLQLLNIISISETKLANNFSLLNRKLNKHDEILSIHQTQMEYNQTNAFTRINQVESNSNSEINFIKSQLNNIFHELRLLNEVKIKHQERIKKAQESFTKINTQLYNTQLQIEEKHSLHENVFKEVQQRIEILDKQIVLANDEIIKKQNKVNVERVIKDIQHLKEKDTHFQAEIKLNQHKIEKIEIINQKNQRLQAKKDIEFMKEIEDKVKRQVKVTLKGVNLPNGASIVPNIENDPKLSSTLQKISISSMNPSDKENILSSVDDQRRLSLRKRIPFNMEQDETLLTELLKSNMDSPLSKINQRLNKLEVQQKDINEVIKISKFKKDDKTDTSANIKDKINELKPEVVKLWAKFDTLEDRLSFNQKKMDEKTKILNDLISHQKENNWQRMDEKLKNLQTEIYTNIKDIKAKLDNKVNLVDYQKFVTVNDERIKQINELIYLKSDKLEVKKALLFLESKIKEIILVISEDEQNQKDALLTKKAIKCISCDKQVDKFSGNTTGLKGNWDSLPSKQQSPQTLGRFGMTSFGSLSKKLKKLQGKDLPVLNNKKSNFGNISGINSP